MGQVASGCLHRPLVFDLANEATLGASIVFWASQQRIHRVVSTT
jgi:hypothetical protein